MFMQHQSTQPVPQLNTEQALVILCAVLARAFADGGNNLGQKLGLDENGRALFALGGYILGAYSGVQISRNYVQHQNQLVNKEFGHLPITR